MDVSALEAGSLKVPLKNIVAGASPRAFMRSPSLAFSLRHSKTGYQVVFDLGIRRDIDSLPPGVRNRISHFDFQPQVPQSVSESLRKGGVTSEDVDAVVVSHLHWDHLGDPDPFTRALFVVGEGCKVVLAKGYPYCPGCLYSLRPPSRLNEHASLRRQDMNTSIGPFPKAYDYFGDGSMYIVDAPGHLQGHVNVLARTSPNGSWILLGGDSAGDFRLITGEKEMGHFVDTSGVHRCIHVDKELAMENIRRIRSLLTIPKVQVLIAHDAPWYEANRGGPAFLPGVIPPVV
ncbi:beta-lactamase-like protein [Butyriboletus roseoflavus]|nr:beta-lactamase-like protein [Butyriboletus roseoflavus]